MNGWQRMRSSLELRCDDQQKMDTQLSWHVVSIFNLATSREKLLSLAKTVRWNKIRPRQAHERI